MKSNENFELEYFQYLQDDYISDFNHLFYIDFKRADEPQIISYNHFKSDLHTPKDLQKHILQNGLKDKKRFFNFIITNFYNQFLIQLLKTNPHFDVQFFYTKFINTHSIEFQNQNPWIGTFQILTTIENWTEIKTENLKKGFSIFLKHNSFYSEFIQKKIENQEHLIFLQFKESKELVSIPNSLFDHLIEVIDILYLQPHENHEKYLSQSVAIEKLKHIKKMFAVNPNLFFAIGDIHGYKISLSSAATILGQFEAPVYFLGDYLDRGPDSIGTVDLLIELQKRNPHWVVLRGNHEDSFLQFVEQNKLEYVSKLLGKNHSSTEYLRHPDRISSHYQYLKDLPIYIDLKNVILLHGGIKDPTLSEISKHSKQDLMWTYGVHKFWNGKKIIRAHEIHKEPTETQNNIALDTGLALKGYLTIAVIENSIEKKLLKAAIKINKQGNIFDIIIY